MKGSLMKWASLLFSLGLLAVIYAQLDLKSMGSRLVDAHWGWFIAALLCFVPQIIVTTLRWRTMVSTFAPLSFKEALGMVMAGKALNALVPSKLGEMSKAYFLKRDARLELNKGLPIVLLEKLLDLGGLCAWMLLGVALGDSLSEPMFLGGLISVGVLGGGIIMVGIPTFVDRFLGKIGGRLGRVIGGWGEVMASWRERPWRLGSIVVLSFVLWGLHLLQIYLFFPSLRQHIDVPVALSYIPLSLLAGLLPISMAGMGTRDAALIILFSPWVDAPTMAGVGVLCTMRYWADTLLGVPFFHRYNLSHRGVKEGESQG